MKEIVRQLRLRDLGGIIVLDLIDRKRRRTGRSIPGGREGAAQGPLAVEALQVSDFGLVIVTRKRVKQSIERQLTDPCPYVPDRDQSSQHRTICYEILRR